MRLLVIPLIALVAVGSGSISPTRAQSPVVRAAKTTLAAETARFAVSYSGSVVDSGAVNLADETAVDDRGDIFRQGELYQPITEGEAAVLGIADKRWVETGTSGGYQLVSDPFLEGTRALFEVIGHAEQVQALGRGMERGVAVQRYSAKVPLEAFLAALPPFEVETTKAGDSGPTSWRDYLWKYLGADEGGQSVDLAVDSQGRVRIARLALAEPVTVELYDYGVPVDVAAPPPAQVISSTAYEKLKSDYCSRPKRQTLPRPYPCR